MALGSLPPVLISTVPIQQACQLGDTAELPKWRSMTASGPRVAGILRMMIAPVIEPLQRPRSSGRWRKSFSLTLATVATGLSAGIGSVAFHYLADGDWLATWSAPHSALARLPIVLVIPTLGLLLIGLVLQFIPESRIGGVKEVLEALQHAHAVIPVRRMLNVILSGLVLALGGSVGPEGPMIQMGALLGSQIGQRHRCVRQHLPLMVRAGEPQGLPQLSVRRPAGS
jgi:H+/Cl- antiporter ClcA